MNILLPLIPIIAALIGWLTNKFAIYMLFHPRQPIKLGKWSWQGLIPKRQPELAARIGKTFEEDLLSKNWLQQAFNKVDINSYLEGFAKELIHVRLVPRLKAIPLLGSMINDSALENMQKMVSKEIVEEAQPVLEKVANDCQNKIGVGTIVEEHINQFEVQRLEKVVKSVAKKEFRTIEILGGVLGFVVGLLQLMILFLSGYLSF